MNLRYLFPDPILGGPINHIAGILGMCILGVMGYVGSMGCCIDGDDPGGTAIYPNRFVQEVFQRSYEVTATTETGIDKKEKRTLWL